MKIPKFEAQTEWVKPTEFPDLRQVDEIAIDLETKDPDLIKKDLVLLLVMVKLLVLLSLQNISKDTFLLHTKVVVTWIRLESYLG